MINDLFSWRNFMVEHYDTVGGRMIVDFVGMNPETALILFGDESKKQKESRGHLYPHHVGIPNVRNFCTLSNSLDVIRPWLPEDIKIEILKQIGKEAGAEFWAWYLKHRSEYIDDLSSTLSDTELSYK